MPLALVARIHLKRNHLGRGGFGIRICAGCHCRIAEDDVALHGHQYAIDR